MTQHWYRRGRDDLLDEGPFALEPDSALAAHAQLTARGLPAEVQRDLERMAVYGVDGRESRRVAFRNLYLAPSAFTEARLIYIEHLTRDVMWPPMPAAL